MQNPQMMQQMMQMMNPNANANANANNPSSTENNPAAGNPFAGGFNPFMFGNMDNFGAPESQAPQDDRPPEVRYEEQLRQLNEMGFTDYDRNEREDRSALRLLPLVRAILAEVEDASARAR